MTTRQTSAFPNAIGVPGGSVEGLGRKFGNAQVRAGTSGEILTARALKDYCKPGGPTVLHDLALPMSGVNANIDHVVVSGRRVRIIDTKMWQPGIYWTLFGTTRRGFTRIDHADKKTMKLAQTALARWLITRVGHDFTLERPTLIVWPSGNQRAFSVRFYRPIGACALRGPQIKTRHRRLLGTKPADQAIVSVLSQLVISLRGQTKEPSRPTTRGTTTHANPLAADFGLPTFESDDF